MYYVPKTGKGQKSPLQAREMPSAAGAAAFAAGAAASGPTPVAGWFARLEKPLVGAAQVQAAKADKCSGGGEFEPLLKRLNFEPRTLFELNTTLIESDEKKCT